MENPLELSAPNDPSERIHAFAKDLAWGSINNEWGSFITVNKYGSSFDKPLNLLSTFEDTSHLTENQIKFNKKWHETYPSISLLVSFAYLAKSGERGDKRNQEDFFMEDDGHSYIPFEIDYTITGKAFALLEKPPKPTNIFISYKQSESSALALLIESRLSHIDSDVEIFIDKNIPSGDSINSRIEKALEPSRFFICLLGLKTLIDSQPVRDEINLAKSKPDCTIIPICHNGYTPDDLYNQYFGDNKAIIIKHPESAEEYEINMTRLLIRLGYPTT